ncbi:MAG: hypothetical protein KF862_20150 [Chitinophagaceae bacterium]|nr:hypothetical protein [Chitinophagaceae bacterium]
MKIAFITYSGNGHYSAANNFNEYDDLLPYLQQQGLDISAEIWDDPNVDWSKYTIALLKTPWDYFQKFEAFKAWLNKIESLSIRLLNDYNIVRWNMDKHYLKDIAAAGLEVIPAVFLDKGAEVSLLPLFEELNTLQLIVKPCVSGGSKNTIIVQKTEAGKRQKEVDALLSMGDFIVQPLMDEVYEGEWSFIFFNGHYSHTVLKKPAKGDFRVQQIYGGTIETLFPGRAVIDRAKSYVDRFVPRVLYARVDGLMIKGRFVLMELELVEPFLYLSYGENAVQNYYNALLEHLYLVNK